MTDGHLWAAPSWALILPKCGVVWELVSALPVTVSLPGVIWPPRGTAGDLAFGLPRLSRNEIKEGRVTSLRLVLCLHMKGPHFLPGMGAV